MDLFEFIVLTFVNLAVIYWIVKRQGINSSEGYCAAFIFMAVITDALMLLYDYFFQPGNLPLGADEITFRLYPTFIHIVGMLVLMAGLFLGNPKPEPVTREFSEVDLDFIAYTGVALLIFGLILTAFAVYFTGAYGGSRGYFESLDTMRSGSNPGKMGGFWLRGGDFAVFGTCLMLAGWGRVGLRFVLSFIVMMIISFVLKPNKGGFETAFVWAALVLYTYNPRRFRSLIKPRIILVASIVAIAGIGLKIEMRGSGHGSLNWEGTGGNALKAIETRWGDQGLYRGYCQFVNLAPRYHYLFTDYRIARYTLIDGWIPRFIYPSKQEHPLMGLGYLFYADQHSYKNETPATGLVGSVYADGGLYTLIPYLLITGFVIGVLRRYAAGQRSPLQWHIPYINFVIFAGLSPEAGILGIVYTIIFAFSITTLAHLAVLGFFKNKLKSRPTALPTKVHPVWTPVQKSPPYAL
ncbi:MAG: hypothetical protein WB992_17105 [Bryobacteraceae bacterium]